MNPKEKFLNDVSDHQLEIIKYDGLHPKDSGEALRLLREVMGGSDE